MPTETQRLEQRVAALQSDLNARDQALDDAATENNERELSRRDWFDEAQRLQAQLAERDALLREVSTSPDWSLSVDLQVRISNALSASAEPSACGYSSGDWECRPGGYLFDAGAGEGYDPQDCTYICPQCRTKDFLEAAKDDAESTSSYSNNFDHGTGLDIWKSAEREAMKANHPAAIKALAELGPVEALDNETVVICNTESPQVERDERVEFEQYALGKGWLPHHLAEKTPEGNYKDWGVQPQWVAWQARAALECKL